MSQEADYLAELRSALAHLDDPPYLEKHPLTHRLGFLAQTPGLSRGQALRRALRLGVAALDPGSGGAPGRLEARSFQVLYQWAICRESTVSIAALLGISRRQAYRELDHAIRALGQVLLAMTSHPDLAGPQASPPAGADASCGLHVREELERLARATDQEVDLCHLLNEVTQSARRLAESRGLELRLEMAVPRLLIAANRVMLRQAVLNFLSYVIGVHQEQDQATSTGMARPFGGPGDDPKPNRPPDGKSASAQDSAIAIRLDRSGASARMRLQFRRPAADREPPQANSPYALARELLRSLGIEWVEAEGDDGAVTVSMFIPLAQERTVLIVDDNEGIIALFRRYLRGRPYRVYGANSAEEGLQLITELQPDIVILDVMMPDRDGWELLQQLPSRPDGRRPQVIVCSIINDPKLAAALGADAFLSKPVDQAGLLQALAALSAPA